MNPELAQPTKPEPKYFNEGNYGARNVAYKLKSEAGGKREGMEQVERLWDEVREVSLGTSIRIDRLHSPPSPLQFLRNYVSPNKPCIISNTISHWPALHLWPNHSYLAQTLFDSAVSLHLTPDGRADSLAPNPNPDKTNHNHPLCFATAHVERVPFTRALDLVLNSNKSKLVAYLQQQNDCFRAEYPALGADCEPHIPWATEALGCLPEAVNLWIGNHLSETSFHKDHYENLYAVVSGEKHFLLLPPTDVHRMYIREYPAAQYSYSHESGEMRLEVEEPMRYVPWSSVDPYASSPETEISKFPAYFDGPEPFQCTVKAGEMLYLPSMWFHHVRQSPDDNGCTIAINYWYDMQFDMKYAYFNFLRSIPRGLGLAGAKTGVDSDASLYGLRGGLCAAVGSAVDAAEANQDSEDDCSHL